MIWDEINEHIRNGLIGALGFWITTFFMEWFVFRGHFLPDGYVLRVWNFIDFFAPGSWRSLEWINSYKWLAMPLDYLLEGAVAFCSVFTLSWTFSKLRELSWSDIEVNIEYAYHYIIYRVERWRR